MDTDFAGITTEGTGVFDIVVVYIEQDDIEVVLIHLASTHHFSSSRYPLYFPVVAKMICSLFHHDLPIYKIYNID